MQVILSVFCLSSENNLRICVCICNLFFGGRDEVQKKMIFWKNGGGGNKMWVLIIGQSKGNVVQKSEKLFIRCQAMEWKLWIS